MTPVEDGFIEFRFGAAYLRFATKDIDLARFSINAILDAKKLKESGQ